MSDVCHPLQEKPTLPIRGALAGGRPGLRFSARRARRPGPGSGLGPGGEEFLHEGRQVLGFGDQVKVAAVVDAQLASRDQAVQGPRVYLRDDGVIVAGALRLFQEMLPDLVRVLGPDHHLTLRTRSKCRGLDWCLRGSGRGAAAIPGPAARPGPGPGPRPPRHPAHPQQHRVLHGGSVD
jgi:hypothetical protein